MLFLFLFELNSKYSGLSNFCLQTSLASHRQDMIWYKCVGVVAISAVVTSRRRMVCQQAQRRRRSNVTAVNLISPHLLAALKTLWCSRAVEVKHMGNYLRGAPLVHTADSKFPNRRSDLVLSWKNNGNRKIKVVLLNMIFAVNWRTIICKKWMCKVYKKMFLIKMSNKSLSDAETYKCWCKSRLWYMIDDDFVCPSQPWKTYC